MSDFNETAPPSDQASEQDWRAYRRLILSELRRLSNAVTAVNEKLDRFHQDEIGSLKIDVAMLKVKAGVWGATGGVVVTVGAILLALLTGYLKSGGH